MKKDLKYFEILLKRHTFDLSLTPKINFMSHETLFALVVISIVAVAFILARLTKSAENISKY